MATLNALAQAVNCDTAETVRWEIAETLDKCAGTKERILEQIRNEQDCDTCPPGFLAVVMQAENLARALGIALDLLGVPTIDETGCICGSDSSGESPDVRPDCGPCNQPGSDIGEEPF
jgi:hypothetical protein